MTGHDTVGQPSSSPDRLTPGERKRRIAEWLEKTNRDISDALETTVDGWLRSQSAALPAIDPTANLPVVRQAPLSLLVSDPDWIHAFRWLIGQLLDVGHDVIRYDSVPSYRDTALVLHWGPFLDGLKAHVWKAVEAGRNVPPTLALALDPGVFKAYQLVCIALDDHAASTGPTPPMMTALEGIAELLAHWQPTVAPAVPPPSATVAPLPPGNVAAGPVPRPEDSAATGVGGTPRVDNQTDRPDRNSPGDAKIKIVSALEALTNDGKWNKSNREIAKLAGVAKSTYHRLLKDDRQVKRVMAEYRKQRLGRGPSRASET